MLVVRCKGWLDMSIIQHMDPVTILPIDLQPKIGLQQLSGHPDNLWNDCGP